MCEFITDQSSVGKRRAAAGFEAVASGRASDGELQVNFGLLCGRHGRPVVLNVFEGDVGGPRTVLLAVRQLQQRFGLSRMVLVGDRGMSVQARLATLHELEGIDWITVLHSGAIHKLERAGQLERCDEAGLFEIVQHPDDPGEPRVACRNQC